MKQLKVSILIFLLLLSMVAAVACNDPHEGEDSTTTPAVVSSDETTAGAVETLPELEVKNYDDYEFKVLWPTTITGGHFLRDEIYSEGISAEPIEDAVYMRNAIVEEKYGVKITSVKMSFSSIASTISTLYMSGAYEYDALCTQLLKITPLAIQGALADFQDSQYYDEADPWWDHTIMQGFSIANRRYFGSGDIIISDNYYPFVTMVNLGMANDLSLENPYSIVDSGKWTIDKLLEMGKNVSTDDGDGEWTNADRYGLLIVRSGSKGLFYGAGLGISKMDADGFPELIMNSEKTQAGLEKILDVFYLNNMALNLTDSKYYMSGMDHAQTSEYMFTNGQALFQICELISTERQRGADINFGLLPMPKYDETQENYICVLNDATLIGIPSNTPDLDRNVLILSAMSRESVETVTPAFFETTLTAKYLNDGDSVRMLQLVLDNVIAPDLATTMDYGGLLTGFYNLVTSNSTNFSSMYKTGEKTASKAIENLKKNYQ